MQTKKYIIKKTGKNPNFYHKKVKSDILCLILLLQKNGKQPPPTRESRERKRKTQKAKLRVYCLLLCPPFSALFVGALTLKKTKGMPLLDIPFVIGINFYKINIKKSTHLIGLREPFLLYFLFLDIYTINSTHGTKFTSQNLILLNYLTRQ